MICSLQHLAVRAEKSRGRKYPEPSHPYRNEYQRDRDRVVHCRAFRRLENKTQVFTRRFSDHFRNRLTHTIEVAQISRTIAGALGLNTDLVEALALAHDIGHPPFGHAGEKALDAVMREHGLAFDHNLHALRIVEDFELRYASFPGLNLSFEVREGIVKHSRDYQSRDFPQLQEYALTERPPLEAQLLDLTDEIAYSIADLDDGFEACVLSLECIRAGARMFDACYEESSALFPAAANRLLLNEALKRMLDRMVTDLIEHTSQNVRRAGVNSLEEVRSYPRRLVGFSEQVETERRQARDFLYAHLYFSPELKPEKDLAERIITELFSFWMEQPEALPENYQEKIGRESLPRIICDYIAGMTDNYILEQHQKLLPRGTFNPA